MYDTLLDTFTTVVVAGSVTKAAEKLFISPTAVYKQLHLLEKRTGLILFDKEKRGVQLTEAGRLYYKGALDIIGDSKRLISKASFVQRGNRKYIKAGISLTFPAFEMIRELFGSNEMSGNRNVKLVPVNEEITNDLDIFSLFSSGKINFLCISMYLNSYRELFDFYFIGYTNICLAVPPGNALSHYSHIPLSEIAEQTIIAKPAGLNTVYDAVRQRIKSQSIIVDSGRYFTIETINHCVENNCCLLTLEKWADIYPNLKMVRFDESFPVSYGVLFAKEE